MYIFFNLGVKSMKIRAVIEASGGRGKVEAMVSKATYIFRQRTQSPIQLVQDLRVRRSNKYP